ncbi:hypothetical protein SGRIM128S_06002 [Streptomyces griseomycini]
MPARSAVGQHVAVLRAEVHRDGGAHGVVRGCPGSCRSAEPPATAVSASAKSTAGRKTGQIRKNQDAATTNLFGEHGHTAVRRRAPQHIPDCEHRTNGAI